MYRLLRYYYQVIVMDSYGLRSVNHGVERLLDAEEIKSLQQATVTGTKTKKAADTATQDARQVVRFEPVRPEKSRLDISSIRLR